jgi:threonyl-tRNA synthetase
MMIDQHEVQELRDHRRLGRELELFGSDPLIGSGLPYWLPDGAAVRHALEEYVRELERLAGYRHVYSPALGKRELFEISGHWGHYQDEMFPPMEVGGEQFVLRPSLCPHHALVYRSRGRSHRELPLRIAELGPMFRSELSGALGGLSRVRAIQLNDAHVFCAPEQIAGEAALALDMVDEVYAALGIGAVRFRLSLRGAGSKYVDDPEMWDRAEAALRSVLVDRGMEFEEESGEAAFYGPKIDVQIADAAGREVTLSTVQVDFHQPRQFGLEYAAADGSAGRPVMVHRSLLGGIERLMGHLIEVHGGAWPVWLAPLQVAVLPVGAAQQAAAEAFAVRCLRAGLRAEVVGADRGTLGARVRGVRLAPYQAVFGAREMAAGEVALRLRDGRRLEAMPEAAAVEGIGAVAAGRGSGLWR